MNISAPVTLDPLEISAPLTVEGTVIDAPITLEPAEISAPVTVEQITINAPVTLTPIVINAPVTIGGAGGDSSAEFFLAAVNIPGHRAVAFNEDGELILASSADIKAIGIIRDAVTAGNLVRLYRGGQVNGFSGLVPDAPYWLGVDGAISALSPPSGIIQQLATASATTTLLVEISEPTYT